MACDQGSWYCDHCAVLLLELLRVRLPAIGPGPWMPASLALLITTRITLHTTTSPQL